VRVVWRSRRLQRKWPWQDWAEHLERPLAEIREDFGIRLV
jgi:hypothetical protein